MKEAIGREVTFEATVYADTVSGKDYEYEQLIEGTQANLDTLSFQVGDDMAAGEVSKAVQVYIPFPEVQSQTASVLGTQVAYGLSFAARGDGSDTGDDELELRFR